MPSTRTGAGSPSRPSAWAMNARCAVGHDTRCAAATSDTDRAASPIADPIWARNRRVVRARGGTSGIDSVNDPTSQDACWHLHRVLHQRNRIPFSPYGMSFGAVAVRSFTDLETTPHDGHVAAPASAVTTCTIRVPSASARHEHPPTRTNLS